MITLDKLNIMKTAQELHKSQSDDYSELIELLGGEKALLEVFDEYAVHEIIGSLVSNGKIHNQLEEDGLDILEGLLNKQIRGNLGKFYNINPNYILALPDEQKKAIANSLSEGSIELEETLMLLWNKGIKTVACDGVGAQYLRMDIEFGQLQEVYTRILNQYKQGDDIRFFVDGYEEGEKYIFQIEGKDEKAFFGAIRQAFDREYSQKDIIGFYQIAYEMLQDHYMYSSKELEEKKQLDIDGIDDGRKLMEMIISEGLSERDNDWTDEKVEALIQDNDAAHIGERKAMMLEKDVEIEGLKTAIDHSFDEKAKLQQELETTQQELKLAQEENEKWKQKYKEVSDMFKATKDFVVNKLGRIPFVGKAVIRAMNKELNEKALPLVDKENVDDERIH